MPLAAAINARTMRYSPLFVTVCANGSEFPVTAPEAVRGRRQDAVTVRVGSVFTIACAVHLLLQAPVDPAPVCKLPSSAPAAARGWRQDAVTIRVGSVFTIACAIL